MKILFFLISFIIAFAILIKIFPFKKSGIITVPHTFCKAENVTRKDRE